MGMCIFEKQILVVNRDAAAGLLLSYVLEEEGYLVCSVRHERAAWHELDHKRFDAVVMGFSLPSAELAILKRCRSQIASVPASFISVGSSGVHVWRPVATLRRPYDIATLLRILRAILHEPAVHPFGSGIARPDE